jgi:rhodanese-related sulfurtransferase
MKNRFKKLATAAIFFGFSAMGCSQHETFDSMASSMADKDVPTVKPEEFDVDTVVFLDSRAREEYDVSHIKDARYVGYKEFELSSVKDIPKDKPIVIYCSVGYRSGKIGEQLQDAGYTNVQNLYGGIFYWVNQGLPVYDENSETSKIHPYNEKWGNWLTKGEKTYE